MKYFVSCGEMSGDLHISYLVSEIKKIDKEAHFFGMAGEHSKKVGVEIIQNIDELAIMGFLEALFKYRMLKQKAQEYLEFIKKNEIKKVILIDYGGFNLYFLKLLKKRILNIEVYYYIPPKLWVWGAKRIKKLKLADHILVIFPWEVEFYKKQNVEVVYYGNPLIDKIEPVSKKGESILLLPGSRKQEIQSLLPEMLKVVKELKNEKFILKLASKKHLKWIDENTLKLENLEINFENTLKEVVEKSKLSIAASGTVTLEIALMQLPTIVGYNTSFLNEMIARMILKIKYVSLPNITIGKEVFVELLQKDFTSEKILDEIKRISVDNGEIKKNLIEIRKILGGENVIAKYAKYIGNIK